MTTAPTWLPGREATLIPSVHTGHITTAERGQLRVCRRDIMVER